VHIDSIYIHNRVNVNNDGFHFISSQFITVSNCVVLSQDDACALFGSCKFVTITNCVFSARWSVFRFGGGPAENISISNCVLSQVYGCPIKFQGSPGSHFENISFSDLVLDDVTGPIYIACGPSSSRSVADEVLSTRHFGELPPAVVRNISFSQHNWDSGFISGTAA
jgi:polygalacturonase